MSKFNFKQFLNILDFYNNGSEWNNPLNNEWLSFDLGNSNHNSQNEIRTDDLPQRSSDFIMPDEVPILPLRGLVVYPQTAIPLTIGQSRSINLIDDVISHDRLVGLVASRNPDLENPGTDDLYHYGTLGIIHRFFRAPDGTIRLLVQGVNRFLIKEYIKTDPYLFAKIELSPEIIETGLEIEALARSARDQFNRIADLSPSIPRELVSSVTALQDPLQTIYTIANFQRIDLDDAQSLLEINSTSEKLLKLVTILSKECEVLELGQKIQNDARSEIEKVQREYYLREQLKAIQKELGEQDEQAADIQGFREKIDSAKMTPEAEKEAKLQLDRLSRLPSAAAEYGVIRTYLDWLVSLPWAKTTEDNMDISHAREVLNQDHYGLNDIKERILEYLAVRKLRQTRKAEIEEAGEIDLIRRQREGVILCFVGPPGVGKTSLGQSVARALGRNFTRISLGGMRDEAEIRGHRRTYIGALPGRIIQAIRRSESKNVVFMLDEIDKIGSDFRGDPASALLEVLDPEQNSEFRDYYIEVAFDLSQIIFITTANTLETIPPPLLDRMEVIHLSGYTDREKISIAEKYLIPRQLKENGLLKNELHFSSESILTIIRNYTRESGVRNLERQIGAACRKVVTQITEGKTQLIEITTEKVLEMLGRQKYLEDEDILKRTAIPGVVTGLAWTPVGGDVLFIEGTKMPGNGSFKITGSIGKVMEESAMAAYSYVRSNSIALKLPAHFSDKLDIHLHIPAGATPKDGPSAGVTIATALYSLLSGKTVRQDLGMTGEISLSGYVLPVGGIKEKILAAHRSHLKVVILPKQNEFDLNEIPDEIRSTMQFILVEKVEEVFKAAFIKKLKLSKQAVIVP